MQRKALGKATTERFHSRDNGLAIYLKLEEMLINSIEKIAINIISSCPELTSMSLEVRNV